MDLGPEACHHQEGFPHRRGAQGVSGQENGHRASFGANGSHRGLIADGSIPLMSVSKGEPMKVPQIHFSHKGCYPENGCSPFGFPLNRDDKGTEPQKQGSPDFPRIKSCCCSPFKLPEVPLGQWLGKSEARGWSTSPWLSGAEGWPGLHALCT